jgi:histidinol phosphatase-like enzyme
MPVLHSGGVTLDASRRATILQRQTEGWRVFVHAWRPQVARGEITMADVEATFTTLRELFDDDVDIACCPHDAGPPVCWCRKPIPGSVIDFATRRGIALNQSIVVGASPADKTMAERIGAAFESSDRFW